MNNTFKIIFLWALLLFGLVFHSLLATMPIFFGVNISIPDATGNMPAWMNWMALVIYLIPMLAITQVLYTFAKWQKYSNLLLAVLFAVMNVMHLSEEFGGSGVQIVLLTFNVMLSMLLAMASYSWLKAE